MYAEKIDQYISESLKSGCKTELSVWRALKNEFLNYKTAKAGNVIDDAVEGKIIQKLISQHQDSIDQFKAANREDLVTKEQEELNLLKVIAPKEPTDDEIRDCINDVISIIISENGEDYKVSMKDMKRIQSYVREKYSTVNGGKIAKIFGELNKN